MNISHTQLDDCRSNPRSWVQAKAGPAPRFSYGYNQALLHAIHTYHRSNGDVKGARQYLQDSIDRNFKDEVRSEEIQDWLDSYIQWCEQSGVIVADTKFRIKLNLGVLLQLRGEIHRLDMPPGGGYRAILLGNYSNSWRNQLRMPLLQHTVANRYGRPLQTIEIGVQHLDGTNLLTKRYSQSEVARAESDFTNLSSTVERYARNIPGLIP